VCGVVGGLVKIVIKRENGDMDVSRKSTNKDDHQEKGDGGEIHTNLILPHILISDIFHNAFY